MQKYIKYHFAFRFLLFPKLDFYLTFLSLLTIKKLFGNGRNPLYAQLLKLMSITYFYRFVKKLYLLIV